MPFGKGQSGNPKGKPKGAGNATTIVAQNLFDGEAEALVRKSELEQRFTALEEQARLINR